MADNKDKKVLKSSIEREQSQTCLNSAEREKIKGSTNLNVPHLRFPEFSGEWEKHTIGELCEEFKSGKNIKAENIQEGGVYPVFGGNGLRGYSDRYNHEGDYVLIGRQGALCGNVRFVTGKTYITEHAIAAKATNNNYTRFLEYLFVRLNLGQFSDQSAQPGLAVNKLLKIETFVPSKEEQYKIASLLKLLDERIATQNKIIEDLKLLKSAIIKEHYKQHEKQCVLIADLGEPFSVGNLSKDDLTDTGNPCVIYGELFTTYGEIISRVESYTNKSDGMTFSKKGDLLFPSSTTVDAVSLIAPSAINIDNVILGGDMFGIHINSDYNAQYLSYYFNHIAKKQFAKYAKGSTIIHLHYKDIEKAKLLLPCLIEQNKTANNLISLDEKIKIESSYLQSVIKQKTYLLRQMFI